MADGSISFDTKVDTTGVSKGLKEVERQFKETESRYNNLSKTYENNRKQLEKTPYNKGLLSEQTTIEKELDSLGPKLENLRDLAGKMKLLEEPAKEADKYSAQLQKVYERMAKLKELGTDPDSKAFTSLRYDADSLAEKIRHAYAQMEKIVPGSTDNLHSSLEGIISGNQNLLSDYQKNFGDNKQELLKNLENRLKGLNTTMEKTGNKFKKNILTMAKYAIGVRSVYMLVRKLSGALKEGLSNLRQFGSGANPVNISLNSLNNSLTYLKNATAAAFAPILTSAVPILNMLVDALASASNAIARFFALLGNKASYTKAIKQNKDLTKAVGGVGSASKKAGEEEKKALASFDEINQLNLKEDSSGGSGTDVSGMFATEEVGEATAFATAVSEKLLSIWKNLKLTAQEIGNVWNKAWQNNGNGNRIISALQAGLLSMLGIFDLLTAKIAQWASTLDLSPLLSSIAGLLEAINPIIEAIGAVLLSVWGKVILPLIGWVGESSLPAFIEAVSEALKVIKELFGALWPMIQELWNGIIEPFASSVGNGIVVILDSIALAFEKIANWISENQEYIAALGTAALLVLSAILTAIFPAQSALLALVAVLGLVKTHWEDIRETAQDVLDKIKQGVKNFANSALGTIESLINGIIDGINLFATPARSVLSWMGVDVPTLSHVSLPRLATGTVVPPGAGEFAAILGDNNKETEVVSPLSTMKEALKEALQESGGARSQQVVIRFDGNLSQLVRVLKPYIEEENNRAGVTLVTSAG